MRLSVCCGKVRINVRGMRMEGSHTLSRDIAEMYFQVPICLFSNIGEFVHNFLAQPRALCRRV